MQRHDHDGDRGRTRPQRRDRRPTDEETRKALVERHMDLAHSLARRYGGGDEPLEDLVQVASIGLLKAARRYDLASGISFAAFATPTIRGELRRHFRDLGWTFHVPRDLKEATRRVERALARHAGGAPTPAQLAEETGLDVETVLEALHLAGTQRVLSLDAPADGVGVRAAPERLEPLGDEDDERDEGGALGDAVATEVRDPLGDEDDELARARDRVTVAQLVNQLDPREREILRLRFVEDLTQSEIGARVGISQMHVSRLIRSALNRMRLATRPSPRDAPGERRRR